jgi:hypothetical protein
MSVLLALGCSAACSAVRVDGPAWKRTFWRKVLLLDDRQLLSQCRLLRGIVRGDGA